MDIKLKISLGVALLSLCGVPAAHGAALTFIADDIVLRTDDALQEVTLYLVNEGAPVAVAGLELNLQVGDGGPELADFGGNFDGPTLRSINVISGTPFAGVAVQTSTDHSFPQLWVESLHIDSGTVTIPTVTDRSLPFARVTLDATGIASGGENWSLKLIETLNGPTSFFDSWGNPIAVSAPSSEVEITVVPEPGVWVSAVSCLLFAVGTQLRKRRTFSSPKSLRGS